MEIKSNKSANYPLLIDDLVKELLKDVFRVKLYRDMEQYLEDEKKFNAFNDDDDWTGNRIQF